MKKCNCVRIDPNTKMKYFTFGSKRDVKNSYAGVYKYSCNKCDGIKWINRFYIKQLKLQNETDNKKK